MRVVILRSLVKGVFCVGKIIFLLNLIWFKCIEFNDYRFYDGYRIWCYCVNNCFFFENSYVVFILIIYFCFVGVDLKERVKMINEEIGFFVVGLRASVSEVVNFFMFVVAVIDGFVLGGGLEVVLVCDIRVFCKFLV